MKSVLYIFRAELDARELKKFILFTAIRAFDITYDKNTKTLSCDYDSGGLLKESLPEYKYILYKARNFKKEQVYLLMTYKPFIIKYK